MSRRRRLPSEPQQATIRDLSHEGRGIAEVDGKTCFIQGALPHETVSFRYTQGFAKYDEGIAIEIENPHQDRQTPPCPHAGVCGGCRLQHVNAHGQLALKQRVLSEQLNHFGHIEPMRWLPPLTADTLGYRRKARLGVRYVAKKEKLLLGFREMNGRYLADIDTCHVLHPAIGKKIPELAQLLQSLSIYQHIPQLEVAVGDDYPAVIIRHLKPLTDSDLAQIMAFMQQHQLHCYLQPKGLNSIHKIYPEGSDELLHYELPDQQLHYAFHPSEFTQINHAINRQMINQALQLLALQPSDTVLDLFCGLGNFSLPLAQQAKQVIGVEGSESLVARAAANAQQNGINNASFYAADLTQPIHSSVWAQAPVDALLLDPPRSGAPQLIEQIAPLHAKQILYVSCNPATFARDAGRLGELGYRLDAAGIMDMFPHTHHVETMGHFTRSA